MLVVFVKSIPAVHVVGTHQFTQLIQHIVLNHRVYDAAAGKQFFGIETDAVAIFGQFEKIALIRKRCAVLEGKCGDIHRLASRFSFRLLGRIGRLVGGTATQQGQT